MQVGGMLPFLVRDHPFPMQLRSASKTATMLKLSQPTKHRPSCSGHLETCSWLESLQPLPPI